MDQTWSHYWWLIFPIGAFIFGAWDRWLAYRRSRDALDLIKTFSAQGKEIPPELMRQVREEVFEPDIDWNDRDARRAYRHHMRWRRGAYWQWRSAIFTGAVASGFWVASEYSGISGAEGPFRLVAIILTCVAGANFLLALLSSGFRDR